MLAKRVFFVFVTICSITRLSYAKARNYDSDDDYWDRFGENLSKQINEQVQGSLKGLDHLGERITQQVQEGLRPVREMETAFRIKLGNGGTTIATFKGNINNKKFIVRDGVMYDCNGTISDADGTCSGSLNKASFKDKKDFCYANIKTIINNWYCISNGNVNSGMINNNVYCKSSDGSSTLLISAEEYNDLCGNESRTVTYKYFTNETMGDYGSNVQCKGTSPIICTMTETRNNVNVVSTGNRGSFGFGYNS